MQAIYYVFQDWIFLVSTQEQILVQFLNYVEVIIFIY